jgi:hypothetical protein
MNPTAPKMNGNAIPIRILTTKKNWSNPIPKASKNDVGDKKVLNTSSERI